MDNILRIVARAGVVLAFAAMPAFAGPAAEVLPETEAPPATAQQAIAAKPARAKAGANTAVAFVHGTDKHTDAYHDYWNAKIADVVRQGLPNRNNWLVVNCDFKQYMWTAEAAGCLATQLYHFVTSKNITDLVVITHSNGGNVMRWILSNPTADRRYPVIISRIRWVNALAPSSAGTPLADAVIAGNIFESALGWLLGYQSDGVRMQQVGWMAYYNANHLYGTAGRPALPRGFWNVSGSDVVSAPWRSQSYCGGYPQSVSLEFTQNWLGACSDGFLDCRSQEAAGTHWFRDARNGAVFNHNQSRRDCFGLAAILRDDL